MQIIPELRIFSAPGFPEMFLSPLRASLRMGSGGHNCGLLVSKKASFTHERGKFCGIVSRKRFNAHGAGGKTQNEDSMSHNDNIKDQFSS